MRGARAGGPGHVLRPTLAGHRFRFAGVAPSTPSARALVAATANGACARTPSHLPRYPGGMRRRGTPAPMHQGGGGAPGRRPDSRSPPMVAGQSGVDAAADCRLRRSPASVGRRTGAPPPPWRRDVGMLTVRAKATLNRQARLASQSSPPESQPPSGAAGEPPVTTGSGRPSAGAFDRPLRVSCGQTRSVPLLTSNKRNTTPATQRDQAAALLLAGWTASLGLSLRRAAPNCCRCQRDNALGAENPSSAEASVIVRAPSAA